METRLSFDAANSLLQAVLLGAFDLEQAKASFLIIRDAIVCNRAEKVLVDGRLITGEPKMVERFEYGRFAAEAVAELKDLGFNYNPQFAYVLVEPVLDPYRLAETTAINRGMFVQTFDNIEDAQNWLGIQEPWADMPGPNTKTDISIL